MSKYTKIIAAFGVAAGLGVASLPVAGSYATEIEKEDTDATGGYTVNGEVNLSVKINDYIKMTIDADAQSIDGLTVGTINSTMKNDITVATNHHGYTLNIKAGAAGTALKTTGGDEIPAEDGPLTENKEMSVAKSHGWNITVSGDNAKSITTKAVADTDTLVAESSDSTDADGKTTTVTYNVLAATDQPAGTYTGSVIYTATAK